MTRSEKDVDTFIAVAHAVAVDDARRSASTEESRRHGRDLAAFAREQAAAMRRAERAAEPAQIVSGAIRPSILAMTIDAVRARLAALVARYPDLQVAHRSYTGMSDDDLRSALEDVEALVEQVDQ